MASKDVTPTEGGRWLNSRDAADYIGYSLGTLHNFTARGEIQAKKIRGRLRFRVADLDRWMEKHAARTTTEAVA